MLSHLLTTNLLRTLDVFGAGVQGMLAVGNVVFERHPLAKILGNHDVLVQICQNLDDPQELCRVAQCCTVFREAASYAWPTICKRVWPGSTVSSRAQALAICRGYHRAAANPGAKQLAPKRINVKEIEFILQFQRRSDAEVIFAGRAFGSDALQAAFTKVENVGRDAQEQHGAGFHPLGNSPSLCIDNKLATNGRHDINPLQEDIQADITDIYASLFVERTVLGCKYAACIFKDIGESEFDAHMDGAQYFSYFWNVPGLETDALSPSSPTMNVTMMTDLKLHSFNSKNEWNEAISLGKAACMEHVSATIEFVEQHEDREEPLRLSRLGVSLENLKWNSL